MAVVVVKSDAANVTVSLRAFALSLGAKYELMRIIGLGQLKSIRQTFRDSGSPAGSWAPLSPVSLSDSSEICASRWLMSKRTLVIKKASHLSMVWRLRCLSVGW